MDQFLKRTRLKISRHWTKGGELDWVSRKLTPKIRKRFGKLYGRSFKDSGIFVKISQADFGNFKGQVRAATKFLKGNEDELRQLRSYKGVERVYLDFGVGGISEGFASVHYVLPESLLNLAGLLRIQIVITQYAVCD
ncbi:MAG: hypothetical protein JWQ04_457 [Pedosphaera sp.]|nr:hypothetical protein [Pedosphaera sp.]